MIVFDLECRDRGHRFEGWFGSSAQFEQQRDGGLLACPQCGATAVDKAVMAPAVARKGNQLPTPALGTGTGTGIGTGTGTAVARRRPAPDAASLPVAGGAGGAPPPQMLAAMRKLATLQAEMLKSSRFVGDGFAEDARAMHYGERKAEAIHGQATLREAAELLDEGIAVLPLPFATIPPGEAN